MTILHTYVSTYNDLWMMRHYVRHWSRYADKIWVYDDDSTDGTREFLESCAPLVEVRSPGFHGIDELMLQAMRNREYKNSRGIADWVVIGDSDEFHYHPNLLEALAKKKKQGYCAVVSHGYQMIAERPPEGDVLLTDVIKDGFYDIRYSRIFFRPEIDMEIGIGHHSFKIFENGEMQISMSFTPNGAAGKHPISRSAWMKYPVEAEDREFKMLHYHYIGADHVRERHLRSFSRLSKRNLKNGWGAHASPNNAGLYGIDWYKTKLKERQPII